MSIRCFVRYSHLLHVMLAAALVIAFVSAASAQENTGQSRQAVVSGPPVHIGILEELGLLSLARSGFNPHCSASLLTNEWIITAAHCLNANDISNPSAVTLTANWESVQTRQAREIRSLGIVPIFGSALPDIALIRVGDPFSVRGSRKHFRQQLIANRMDNLMGYPIETYGRGINVLAQGSGATAMPSQNDGQYRAAKTQITKVEGNLYWFPRNSSNQIVAGGDSGGPSFIITRTGRALVGVHSKCRRSCLPGQPCPTGSWAWVSNIPECADAPIATVYAQVSQIIKESVASLAKDPVGPVGERGSTQVEGTGADTGLKDGRFDTSAPPPSIVSYIYAVGADGNLEWRRHDGAEQGLPQWQSPQPVSGGWGSFKHVFHGGKNIIYAVNQQGDLLWYRHDTAYGVRPRNRRSPNFTGPRVVGQGWQNFRHVFAAGDGIIYAVDQGGNLLWYKHKQYTEAVEMPMGAGSGMVGAGLRLNWVRSWEDLNPRIVGRGWGDFTHVFPGGDGIIYAVTQDGKLSRYRHVGYLQGRGIESPGAWEGPESMGVYNWSDLEHVFSRGDGIIYGVTTQGDLLWFKRPTTLGKRRRPASGGATTPSSDETSDNTLAKTRFGFKKVGDGWGGFLKVFALLPISAPDVVR